jgi:ABC-type antimicrobial peptide transport system permease subunit
MLTRSRLVLRNLLYHWRGNLAVMLGVAVGSAVLTGALLVGDSLRGSLRARVEQQLGGVNFAARFPRAIRADIADGLPGRIAPVLMLPGSLQAGRDAAGPLLGRVTVIGVDDRFKPIEGVDWNGAERLAVISDRVASRIGVKPGDTVTLGVERFSDLPRSSSIARRSTADVNSTEELRVAAVLPADASGNDFNLTPNPIAPLNIFVPIRALVRLATGDREPLANSLLSTGEATSMENLNSSLRAQLRIEDYGLKIREIGRKGYVSVESDLLILPPAMATAVQSAAKGLGWRAESTIAYIADTLAYGDREIPYPVIAALHPDAAPPLGPFLPAGVASLANDEIVLLEWPGSALNGLAAGSKIRLSYFDPEVEGEGELRSTELVLRGYIPVSGAAQDRDLVPEIRGVTDPRANLYDWDRPPVLPKEKIRARVPDKPPHPRGTFFNTHKATPMAYVNLATGEKLFSSRYGSVTSIRIATATGVSFEQAAELIRPAILKHLDPPSSGLVFDAVRARLLTASRGGTDFGGLFLGFSLFLIVSALLLVGLLFRLSLDRRGKEVGLLLAAGYRVGTIHILLLVEGLIVATLGAAVGLAAGVFYNRLLLSVLLSLWPDREAANVLKPHVTLVSFALGFGLTLVMSVVALWAGGRGLVRVPPPALLRGETQPAALAVTSRSSRIMWLGATSAVIGIALVVAGGFVSNPDYQAMIFFAGGGLCLAAGLSAVWVWMKRTGHRVVDGRGVAALRKLGVRNASRNPMRSLLTMALLAAAAFLLVAVESFRRQPGSEFLDGTGGSGGFNLIAETDLPLFHSLTDSLGRKDLEDQLLKLTGGKDDSPREALDSDALKALDESEVFPLRLRDGDDASCMNLFQASRPRVLGVPRSLIERGGFKFYEPSTSTVEETRKVWNRLLEPQPDGATPIFCEQNTAQWMLKKGMGDLITMPGDDGTDVWMRIVGTFADSPFQSELLMADDAFARAFPKTGGFRTFLIRTLPGEEQTVSRLLSKGYRANGIVVTPTRERVAAYQAVIGAYLSTFQLLGGLGLLLGVLGLAVVVLRGVWERIGELALLRAVGYRTRHLQLLILAENALLLVLGLSIGVAAALISVAPHVAGGASVPWARLSAILVLVFVVGLAVASGATAGILRVPVIPALRRE